MKNRRRVTVFLFGFLFSTFVYASEDKTKAPAPPSEDAGESTVEKVVAKPKGSDWMVVITPTGGWLNNETTFRCSVPMGEETREQTATLTDDGWGLGFTVMGYYKWASLTNVFFYFPKVNESSLLGNLEYSEKITVNNLYILVGPAFVISPPGFMDEMMKRRKAKMKAKL